MTDYRAFYRELRIDWLKLRGYLFDTNTGLPALPAVLDGVRRRLEDGEEMGLIYVDPSGAGRLEASCGWQLYDLLIRRVAETLRRYRVAHLSAADAVAQSGVRSDELLLFVGLGGRRPGDRRARDRGSGERRKRSRLESMRQALVHEIAGAVADLEAELHREPPLATAAVPLRLDPKMRIERSIYRSLEIARGRCRRESERRYSRRLEELRRILREADVLTRYQPIVDLGSGAVHGLEALSSAPTGEFFASPEVLFGFAEDRDLLVELERTCRREATRRAAGLLGPEGRAAGGKLFVNCSAHAFADPELVRDLARGILGAGLDPADLVIEVTERVAITEWRPFRRALEEVRRAGLGVAIDDMGSGYSSLQVVGEIQPDYLKFDFSLVHGIHRSSIKRDLLETLIVLAQKIGARSIAEGIETVEELETVRAMGVELGQGFFLAPPVPAGEVGAVRFPVAEPMSL